jgi:hypothetical protein
MKEDMKFADKPDAKYCRTYYGWFLQFCKLATPSSARTVSTVLSHKEVQLGSAGLEVE